MTYNIVKLAVVALLVVVVIVAMGLDWFGDDLGRFVLGLLIGWIVRDVTPGVSDDPMIGRQN